MTYRWNSSQRCRNPKHNRMHSGLVSLHSIECKALDNGLDDYKVTDENAVSLTTALIEGAVKLGYMVDGSPLPTIAIQRIRANIFGDCSVFKGVIRLNTRLHGNQLKTLTHEVSHWVVDIDARVRLRENSHMMTTAECMAYATAPSHGKLFKQAYNQLLDVAIAIASAPATPMVAFVTKENARRILGYDKINAIHTLAWRGDVEQVKVEGFRGKVITLASLEAHMAAKGIDRKRIRMATVYEAMRAA